MKLSRTGWNNVIIFSVMIFILLINTTNNKLFPKDDNAATSSSTILPIKSVILTLTINLAHDKQVVFERAGLGWQVTTKGVILSFEEQIIEQTALAWQQSEGLIQASDIIIDQGHAITVDIVIAGDKKSQSFKVYPLHDQLLIHQEVQDTWLSLPVALTRQLIPSLEELL